MYREETVGKFIYDLGNNQWDIPKLRKLLDEIIPKDNTVKSFLVEHSILRPDGIIRWLRDQGKIFYNEDGEIKYMTGAVVDITERKKIEEELKKYRLHLETLVKVVTASRDSCISL